MWTAKKANSLLNSSPLTDFRFVKGEVVELKEAIKARNLTEAKEEIADVIFFGACFIQARTGLNLPLVGAMPTVRKLQKRLLIWESIFEDKGLLFDKKYLVNGSNHLKAAKVEAALNLALEEQDEFLLFRELMSEEQGWVDHEKWIENPPVKEKGFSEVLGENELPF